jgi:hypothetical protein
MPIQLKEESGGKILVVYESDGPILRSHRHSRGTKVVGRICSDRKQNRRTTHA